MAPESFTRLDLQSGTVDLDRGRFVPNDGQPIKLSSREVAMLRYLGQRAGEEVSRDDLLAEVWGHRGVSLSRAVDTAVTRLRRKIERDPSSPESLCTAHGVGYRLVLANRNALAVIPVAPQRFIIQFADREVDLGAGVVRCAAGSATSLTGTEIRLLERLIQQPGSLVDARTLARHCGICGGREALSNAVYRLRQKLESDPSNPRTLLSVRNKGYRLEAAVYRSSPGLSMLTETAQTVVEQASRLLGLDDCALYIRDGQRLIPIATAGSAPVDTVMIEDNARVSVTQHLRLVRGERSELAVPIVHHDEVVGLIDIEAPGPGVHPELAQRILESFARIAAAAVADLRLALAS